MPWPAIAVLIAAPAWADSSGIKVDQVWARATPGAAKTGAIYLTVTNTGTTPDTLEGAVSTPVAEHADLHEMKMANGVMEMRPVKSLTIDPGKSVTLEPTRLSHHADRAEGAIEGRPDRAADPDLRACRRPTGEQHPLPRSVRCMPAR